MPPLSDQSSAEQLLAASIGAAKELLGERVVDHAENVEDMGRRVREVLGRDPRDHHYAGDKLGYALAECVRVLTIVGWTLDEITELVETANRKERDYLRDLAREIEEDR